MTTARFEKVQQDLLDREAAMRNMGEKRHGQTARQWAEELFSDADCPSCGRGIDHHYIVPAPGLDIWFAQCYEQPKVINTVLVWSVDESGYLTDDDDGGQFTRLSCQAVTTVKFEIIQASDVAYRLETFMSGGLYGIIPPAYVERDSAWVEKMREIETDEVCELRIHLAHFNVDLESFDDSLKSAKRIKRGW